jgi:hypothetical protein
MGDQTAHGGVIVLGCPTVMIGDSGSGGSCSGGGGGGGVKAAIMAAKARRYQCRKQQIAQGEQSDDPASQAAADRFQREIHDIEQAKLAEDVYNPSKGPPPGWNNISDDPSALRKYGLEPDMLEQKGSGFRAQVYEPDPAVFGTDMKPTVAFKGTTMSSGEDWKNNAAQALGLESSYYRNAVGIGNQLADSGADVEITGHSLGGGMASAASEASGMPGTTFNAAGLSKGTVAKYGGSSTDPEIHAYRVSGEVLTGVQEQSWGSTLLVAGIGLAVGGPIGGLVAAAAKWGVSALSPDAVGDKFDLPGTGLNPVDRHSMDQVINGIQEQKGEDQATLQAATGVSCP